MLLAILAGAGEPVKPDPHSDIYARSDVRFENAVLFKPREDSTSELIFTLAPLILQEVKGIGAAATPHPDAFGSLDLTGDTLMLDRTQPVIYCEMDAVSLRGKPHGRVTYLWSYSADPVPPPTLPLQGVRITLNSAGQPAIWEILADTSEAELIFAARSLEEAALAEFGKPLPGRKFALERSREEAPRAIVPRVIDDGPVPMGPILYLRDRSRAVATLICRCMPAQGGSVSGTVNYRFRLGGLAAPGSPLELARERTRTRASFWPGEAHTNERLERCLRLPKSF
jgi:hypothetical protein